ncbi:MAG: hypothetical protein MRJ92_05645 [Nitrospira sp.]|nr:hypothetical protein [Nitrospira sp.]
MSVLFVITTGDTVTYQGNAETQSIAVGETRPCRFWFPEAGIFTGATTNIFDSLRDLLTASKATIG